MDLIINLYQEKLENLTIKPKDGKIQIKRILTPNADQLVSFVKENFNATWASEVKSGLYKSDPTCFIATLDAKIIGFACFDATARGYFGPTGINSSYRGLNIGQALYIETLKLMKSYGYGYAVVGATTDELSNFYGKYLDLVKLDNEKTIYNRLLYK